MRKILMLAAGCFLFSRLSFALAPPLDRAALWKQFELGDFAKLELISTQARTSREINAEGQWQLAVFYESVLDAAAQMATKSESNFRKHMDAWAEQYPHSTTWRIVKAHGIIALGWNARGGGWASEVTEEGWRLLDKYSYEAWTILQDARKISTDDPHLYVSLCWVALGLQRDPADGKTLPFHSLAMEGLQKLFGKSDEPQSLIDEIFEEAIKHERFYLPLYREQIEHHLARWGGSPTELRKFAEHAADITRDQFGDAMYAYVAWCVLATFSEEEYLIESDFDWKRIKAGMERFEEMYPDSSRITNQFCRLACTYLDRETAKAVFARMKEPMGDRFWYKEDWFQFWKKWIEGKVPDPDLSPLAPALIRRQTDQVRALIQSGTDPNTYILPGVSPLMFSVMQNDAATAKYLLSVGAKLDPIDSKGVTILRQSTIFPDLGLTKILLEAGANPNQPDGAQWTALHYAVRDANFPALELLLKYQANVNQPVTNDWTPLHIAVHYRRPKMVRFLLEHGADPTLKAVNGYTALDLAKHDKFPDIAAILESIDPKPTPPPAAAAPRPAVP